VRQSLRIAIGNALVAPATASPRTPNLRWSRRRQCPSIACLQTRTFGTCWQHRWSIKRSPPQAAQQRSHPCSGRPAGRRARGPGGEPPHRPSAGASVPRGYQIARPVDASQKRPVRAPLARRVPIAMNADAFRVSCEQRLFGLMARMRMDRSHPSS